MNRLYVIVGPDFSGKTQFVKNLIHDFYNDLQVIDELALSKAQRFEQVPQDKNYRYGLISVLARAHLINKRNVVALCDNLSIESLVLWKKLATEHGAECIIILFEASQLVSMEYVNKMKIDKEERTQLSRVVADQFKRYDDLAEILTNQLNTINRDLADQILTSEDFVKSQEG